MSKTLEDNKDKDKDKDKYTGLCEEEIVDGFAIFSFLTYTDLEKTVKEQEEALEDKNIVTNNNSNSKGKEIDGCNNKKTSNITGKSASSGGTVQRNRSKKNHSNNNNHKDGNNKESKKSSIVGKGLSGLTSTHHHLNHNHHNNTNHHHSKSIGKNKESKDKVNLNIHHHLNNSNNVKHNMSSSAGNKKQHVTSLTSSPGNGSSEVTSINGPGNITGHSDDKSEPEKARKQGRERDESSCLTGSNATSTASTNVISNTNNKDKLNLSKACHVNNINKNSVNLKHGNHSINKSKSSSTANNSNNSSTILSSTPSGKGKSSNKICHDKSSKIHDALSPVSGSSSLSSSSSSATTTTTTTNIVTPIGTMSSVKHSLKSSSHVDKGCKASPPSKMKKKSQSMTDENHKKKLESIGDESESNRSIDGFKKSSKNPSSGGLKNNRGQQSNTESSKKSHKEVKSRKTSHSKDKDKSGQCKSNGHLKESKLFDQSKESQSKSYNGTTGLSTPSSSCRGRSPINTSSDEICDTKSVTIVAKRTKKRKLKERDKSSNNIKSESSYLKDCALNSGSNGNTGNSGIANHKDKHGALTHHYSISKSSSVPSDNLNPTVVLTATTTAISLNKGKHGLKASNSHLNDKSPDCKPKKIKKKSISSPKSQENQKKQSKAVLSKTNSSNTSKASPSSSSSSSSSSSLSSLSSSSLSSSSSSLSSTNSTLSGVKSTPITCTPTALSTSKVTSTANSISIQVDGESIGCESKFINDRENKHKHHSVKESVKKEKAESLISSVSKSIKLSSSSLFSSKLSMDNTLNPCMMEISCEKGSENCEKTSSSPSTTTTTATIITTTTSTVKNQPERYSQSNLSSPSATPAKRRRTSSSTNDHPKPAKSNLNQEQKLDETINTNTNNGKSVGKNINNNNISNNKNTVNSNNTSSYDKHNDKSVSSNRQNNKVKSDNVESKSLAIITPVTTSDSVSTESTTFSTKVLNACDSSEESQLSSVKPSKPVNPCQTTDSTKSKVITTTTTTTKTTTKSSVLSSESSLETVTTNSTAMDAHCESKEDESKIDKNVNSIVIKEEMRSNQMDECDDNNVNDLKKQELCSSDSTDSTAINDTKCNSIIALSSSESSNGDSVNIEKLGPCSVPVSPSLPSKPPTTEPSASSSSKCVYQTSPSMRDENLSKRGLTNIASKKCDPVNNSCNINCASSNTNSNSSDNSISSISKTIDTTNVSNSISDTNSNSKDQFSNVNPLVSTSVTKSSSKLSTSTPKMKPAEAAISFKLDNLLSGVPPSKSPFCVRSPNSSLMPSFTTPQPSSALTNNVFSMFTPPMQMNSTSFQKPGRWNTMHVRISWEILRQQKASQGDKSNTNSSSPLTITPSSRSFNLKSPTILPPSSSSASSISLPTLSKNSHLPYDLIRPPATNIFGNLRPGLQTPQSQSQQQNQPQPHPQPQPLHHQQNQSQPSTPHSRSLEISSFSASLMNAASGGLNSTPWNHRSPFGPVSLASGHLPYPSLQAPSSSASSSTSSSIPQSLACSLPSSMSTSSTFSVSTPSITAPISSLGKINGNNDILRSSNSIFGLPPRPGEMTSFSTSLYNAAVAAAGHGLNRPNLEAWNSPFAPGPGMSSIAAHNFIRSSLPGFPGFPHPHPNPHSSHNNPGLPGSVPTSMSNNLFANLAPPKTPHSTASSISSSNIDSLMNTPGRPGSSIFPPLGREEHLPPISSSSGCGSVPGSGSSSSSSTSWGGLKAEAEKSESGKHKDGTSRNISSRSKDEMRSAAHHHQQQHYHHQHRSSSNNNNSKIVGSKHSSSSSNHNGDYESSHRREREKSSNSQKREHSRPSSVSSVSSGNKIMKTSSSAFNDNRSSHINESKAKDDRKESMNNYNKYFDRSHKHSSNSIDHSHRDLKSASLLSSSIGVFNNSNSAILFSTASTASFNNSIMSIPTPPGLPPSITSGNNHSSAASLASMNLHVNNAMDHRARLMGLFGLSHGPPPPPSTPSLCHSMPPSPHGLPGHLSHPNPGSGIPSGLSHDFPKSFWSPFFQPHPGFHEFPPRNDFLEREHLLQQYNILNSSGGGAPLTEKLAKEGPLHALLEKESRDKEAAFASVFDKNRLASSSVSTSTSSSTSSSVNAHHPHLRPGDTGLIAPNAPSLASPYGGPSSLSHGPGNLGLGHALPPPLLPPLSQSHPHSHASSSYHHQLQQHHLNQTSPGQSTPSSSSVLMFPPNPYLNSLHSLSASAGSNVRTDLNNRTKSLSSSSSPSSAPTIKQYPHHGASHSPSPMFIPPLNGLTGPHGFIPPPLVNSKLSTLDTSFEVNCVNRSTISMSNPSTPASGISLADLKESKSR